MIIVCLLIFDLSLGAGLHILKRIGGGSAFYKLFDFSEKYIPFAKSNIPFFKVFVTDYYDPITGWNNPRSKHLVSEGCAGSWEAFYDAMGARKTPASSHDGKYSIVCVGDSFTHGNEVDDSSTYPAILERLAKVAVGNFGVGGFDVFQSVLQYEGVLSRIDTPKIGVLCIMYENGRRNLNAFRPVYSNSLDTYEAFLFKPYFDGNAFVDAVIRPDENTFERSLRKAESLFSTDFWAKPKVSFPYSLSVFRAVSSHNFEYMAFQKINKIRGRGMYSHDYNSEIILDSMRQCVNRFVSINRTKGIFSMVVFIPPNTQDLTSPNALIAELQKSYDDALVLNLGDHSMDWEKYIVREGCHPTPYGYTEIANFIYAHIAKRELLQ